MRPPVDTQALEEARLDALRQTGLLDTPPEQAFDLITALAAKALNVPVVLMSLVDADRQFFKRQCGLPQPWAERRETPAFAFVLPVRFDARRSPRGGGCARTSLVRENLAVAEINVVA